MDIREEDSATESETESSRPSSSVGGAVYGLANQFSKPTIDRAAQSYTQRILDTRPAESDIGPQPKRQRGTLAAKKYSIHRPGDVKHDLTARPVAFPQEVSDGRGGTTFEIPEGSAREVDLHPTEQFWNTIRAHIGSAARASRLGNALWRDLETAPTGCSSTSAR